jgi:hypothetical protein
VINEIDTRSKRTEETAKYPAENHGNCRNNNRNNRYTGNNRPGSKKRQVSIKRIKTHKPPGINAVGYWKTYCNKKGQ